MCRSGLDPRREDTPPHRVHIVWHMHARSTRSLHRPGCCLQPAVVDSADTLQLLAITPYCSPLHPRHYTLPDCNVSQSILNALPVQKQAL